VRSDPTTAVHLDAPDVWASRHDRPNLYTEEEAAHRTGRTRRTIRQWRVAGWLTPVPGSLDVCGQYMYAGPALTEAEQRAARGRVRRRGLLP
jgi:hypothetical protein